MSVNGLDALYLLDRLEDLAPVGLRAEANRALEQGLLQRRLHAQDVLFASWRDTPNLALGIQVQGNGFALLCSCERKPEQPFCVHLTALALAWIYDRASFAEINSDVFERYGLKVAAPQEETQDLKSEYVTLLAWLRITDIRDMARRMDIRLKTGLTKDELVRTLAAALTEAEMLRRLYERLSERAQRLLDLMTLSFPDGRILLEERFLKQAARLLGCKAEDCHNAYQELADNCFVFQENLTWSPEWCFASRLRLTLPQGATWVPVYNQRHSLHVEAIAPQQADATVLQLLLLVQANPQAYRLREMQSLAATGGGLADLNSFSFSADSVARLQAALKPGVGLRTDLQLSLAAPATMLVADSLKRLAGELGVAGEYVDFLVRLLLQDDLLFADGGYLQTHPSDSLLAYIRQPQEQRIVRLAWAYMNLEWSDFYRALQGQGDLGLSLGLQRFLQRHHGEIVEQFFTTPRSFLWHLLGRAPSGQWLDIQALVEQIGAVAPAQALGLDGQVFSFDWARKKLEPGRKEDWLQIYLPLLTALLEGPARWLGLVETGYVEKKLVAFRLTGAGEALLERPFTLPPAAAKPGKPAIRFTAEGGILADLSVCNEQILRLLALLPAKSEGGGVVYQFVPAMLPIYLDAEGWTIEQIFAVLEQAAGGPLPPVLRQKLELWQQNLDRAQFYSTVALIELGDDYALPELLATTDLARYLFYQFGPRLVAVDPTGVPLLQRQMIANGHTPRVVQK